MVRGSFGGCGTFEGSEKWEQAIKREETLYDRGNEMRSEFYRDYTRLLHSLGYSRLKHKTQVFFNTRNDHVCTRLEHVNHVNSVSYTIANTLGLNTELTAAIAIGHDIGHAPFGHQGESELKKITKRCFGESFFHERNSLNFADNIELLQDDRGNFRNLFLTYAVRDGIIAHCGEKFDNGIFPRREAIDLRNEFTKAGQHMPYTWEGCVVKLSDKIAYLGRDIEDAFKLGFIGDKDAKRLRKLGEAYGFSINTTGMINSLVSDICENSSPKEGMRFSEKGYGLLKEVRDYNYKVIYENKKFDCYRRYVRLIITSLFGELSDWYKGKDTLLNIDGKKMGRLSADFGSWLAKYCIADDAHNDARCTNIKIYGDLADRQEYLHAVVDYIAGMTDQFAIEMFGLLTSF